MSSRDITRLAALICIGVSLNWLETQFFPMPVPGARLGLANIVAVLGLSMLGFKKGLLLITIRVVVSSIITGKFMGLGFFMGGAGALASLFFMAMFIRKSSPPSRITALMASTGGAIIHNVVQLIVFGLFMNNLNIVYYLPLLLLVGIPGGIIVGLISCRVLQYDDLGMGKRDEIDNCQNNNRIVAGNNPGHVHVMENSQPGV